MELEKTRKEIYEAIKNKSFNEAVKNIREIFKSKNIEIQLKEVNIQNYHVFEFYIEEILYGFQCKHNSFLIWKWWNVRIMQDIL